MRPNIKTAVATLILIFAVNISYAKQMSIYESNNIYANTSVESKLVKHHKKNKKTKPTPALIKIKNGNGEDLKLSNCNKLSLLSKLPCEMKNFYTKTFAKIDRPSEQKIILNNKTYDVYKRPSDIYKGSIEVPVLINNTNEVKLKSSGPATSSSSMTMLVDDENSDTIPPYIYSNYQQSNVSTNMNDLTIQITDDSDTLTTVWDLYNNPIITDTYSTYIQIPMQEGSNSFTIQSKDTYDNTSYLNVTNINYDTTPALLNIQLIPGATGSYGQPMSYELKITSNESLQNLTVNNTPIMWTGMNEYSYLFDVDQSGHMYFNIGTTDLAGNMGTEMYDFTYDLDNLGPNISSSLTSGTHTQNNTWQIDVNDNSSVTNTVYKDESIILETNDLNEFYLVLDEGIHTYRITSVDQYGNQAQDLVLYDVSYDITAPQILSRHQENYYFNAGVGDANFNIETSEPLASLLVDGVSATNVNSTTYMFSETLTSSGVKNHTIVATDLAGNTSTLNVSYNAISDASPPSLIVMGPGKTITNLASELFQFYVTDESSTLTTVKVNGVEVTQSQQKTFSYSAQLNIEGENTIEAVAVDQAGNISNISRITIVKDTTAPIFMTYSPSGTTNVDRIAFIVSGTSNEKIQSAQVNDLNLAISANGLNFSAQYVSPTQGTQTLNWKIKDLVGNEAILTTQINIIPKLIIPELVTVIPDTNPNYSWITGQAGAARPNVEVSATTGFFSTNNGSTVSNLNGSFAIRLENFDEAKIKATDNSNNETFSFTLINTPSNSLSGIIKDTDDNPLPNVTVSIEGSSTSVVTNSNGMFNINSSITGDQKLIVDGGTVPQAASGPARQFGKTKISVNIGLNQNSILERAIYLAPLYLDNSETLVLNGSTATVESIHAPNVKLEIPANATQFPDGSTTGKINIILIDASKSTMPVPENFVPTKVLAMEPSGTTFSHPVQITLPNDSELPAKTPMIFLSLNSKTGKWEVDGLGKVTDDGNSIKTNTNSGITHFSLTYAVPLSPIIASIKNPNLMGVDTSQGALETLIAPPSYKINGETLTPSLKYKSSWANPTAVVSKSFMIPSENDILTAGTGSGTPSTSYYDVMERTCYKSKEVDNSGLFPYDGERCDTYWSYYYNTISYTFDWQMNNFWVPDRISSQFFVGKISSEQVSFENETPDITQIQTQLPGTKITNSIATNIIKQSGIPQSSVISYALELKDPDTNKYLESGMHPSLARFEIRLKNLRIVTSTITATETYGRGNPSNRPIGTRTSTLAPITTIDTTALAYMPQDDYTNILVQNKVESKIGRGWDQMGVQKIVNPDSATVLIENEDGSLANYSPNHVISTLADAELLSFSPRQGVDLSYWPNAYVVSSDGKLAKIDLSASNTSLTNLFDLPKYEGKMSSQGYYQCTESVKCDAEGCYPQYAGNFKSVLYNYRTSPQLGGLIKSNNGDFYFLDKNQHAFYNQNGQNKIIGQTKSLDSIFETQLNYPGVFPKYVSYFNGAPGSIPAKCSNLGINCDIGAAQPTTYNCNQANLIRTCTTSSGALQVITCNTQQHPQFMYTPSVGSIGQAGSSLSSLNNPAAIIATSNGEILIADSGNNRVISYNNITQEIKVIAGSGQNFDNGDGNLAINASLYHPKALAIDNDDNIYIATENGYVRKIDTQGIITTFAGKLVTNGGSTSDQANAHDINLNNPSGLVFDNINNVLYISDTDANRVMQVNLNTGIANKIAGDGTCASNNLENNIGDGKAATFASICKPTALGLDSNRNLLIVDQEHGKIRRVVFSAYQSGAIAYTSSSIDKSTLFKNPNGTWTRLYRNGNYASFNAKGQQVLIRDRLARITQYQYDNNDNLVKIIYPNNQELNYTYVSGKLSKITDPAGRETILSHSGDQLTGVQFPDNSTRSFEYDSKGQMLKETNKDGYNNEYSYNEWNRLKEIKFPNGKTKKFNDISSQTIANNYTSDSLVPMQNLGLSNGKTSNAITDENNQITTSTIDSTGLNSGVKNALGEITKVKRNNAGLPILITKPDLSTTEYNYDPATHDLISIKDTTTGISKDITYNSYGNILSEKDGKGLSTTYTYESSTGLIKSSTTNLGVKTNYEYNFKNLVSKVTVIKNSTTIYTEFFYNNLNQLIKIIDSSGKSIEFSYDLAGNNLTTKSSSNGSDQTITTYTYDALNRIKSVVDSKNQTTSYDYTPAGNILSITTQKGIAYSYEYDNLSRLVKKTDAFGKFYQYGYDETGNRTLEISPNGIQKTFEYDALNRLTKVNLPDDTITLKYNSAGHLIEAKNNESILSNDEIDTLGRIKKTSISDYSQQYPKIEFQQDFDNNSNVTQVQTTLGTINYSYTNENQLASILNSVGGENISYMYDDLNRLSQINRSGTTNKSTYTYDTNGNLSTVNNYIGSTKYDFTNLGYDQKNMITSKVDYSGTKNYSLDSNGQLTATIDSTSSNSESFSYDENGNRLQDSQNISLTYDSYSQRLNEDTNFTYLYDDNGNLVRKTAKLNSNESYIYVYNSKNQVVQIHIVTGQTNSITKKLFFTYDVLGRRMSKKVQDFVDTVSIEKNYTRYYIYNGKNIYAEFDGNQNLLAKYLYNPQKTDDLVSVDISPSGVVAKLAKFSGTYYFVKDHLGSTTAIVNSSNQVVQRYKYGSFGKILKITDGNDVNIQNNLNVNNRFTYTGREYDSETDLYYYRARYYDANLGRFIQEDPFIGYASNPLSVTNRYIYTYNNPINLTDSSGMNPDGSVTYQPGSGGGYGGGGGYSGGGGGGYGYGSPTRQDSLTPVTPPSSAPGEHLRNAIQFVSLFIPEVKNAQIFEQSLIHPKFMGATIVPYNVIIINSQNIPNGGITKENKAQIVELLDTVYHEATHYKEGYPGWIDSKNPFSDHHEEIDGKSHDFTETNKRRFLRIYYGFK